MSISIIGIELCRSPRSRECCGPRFGRVPAEIDGRAVRPRQLCPSTGEHWIHHNRPLEQLEGLLVSFRSRAQRFVAPSELELVGGQVFRPRSPRGFMLRVVDDAGAAETAADLIVDVGLYSEKLLRL